MVDMAVFLDKRTQITSKLWCELDLCTFQWVTLHQYHPTPQTLALSDLPARRKRFSGGQERHTLAKPSGRSAAGWVDVHQEAIMVYAEVGLVVWSEGFRGVGRNT